MGGNRKAGIVTPQVVGEVAMGENVGGKDRRLSRRLDCEGFAEGFAIEAGYLFRGEIRDISQTGCYIMTKALLKLERLTEVDLEFMLNKRNYHTRARVMDVRARRGVGLEFLFRDSRAEESIKHLLQTLAEGAHRNNVNEASLPSSASSGTNSPLV
jgi:hypothetical protein